MKKTILFKTLVDILYFLHFIGLLGIILILPFGIVNINQANISVEDWSFFNWIIVIVSLTTYIIFLIGLYYLRKMARHLLTHKYFSKQIIKCLKISGTHFLLAGVMFVVIMILGWIGKLREGLFEFVYDINLMVPLYYYSGIATICTL